MQTPTPRRLMILLIALVSCNLYFTALALNKALIGTVPMIILYHEADGEILQKIAGRIQADLSFSGQCKVAIKPIKAELQKPFRAQLAPQYALAVCLQGSADKQGIEWRVYETYKTQMIAGQKYIKRGDEWRGWAHAIADHIWPLLTGQPGMFSSRIVYCKDIPGAKNCAKQVWVADFDGTNEQLVVDNKRINVAPRWNTDKANPLVFFSQYTDQNLQLRTIDLKGVQKVASDFDGSNMLPCFSPNGNMVIYCVSRGNGECHLYLYQKGMFKRITSDEGRNVSPTLAQQGKVVYYCSDSQSGKPQIYRYTLHNDECVAITDPTQYCASPRSCTAHDLLVYTKMVNGTMQLMVYNPTTQAHEQITSDEGNKEEPAWSPCGTYIMYAQVHGTQKKLVVYNKATGSRRTISNVSMACSYPDWSPLYTQFPVFQECKAQRPVVM